MSKNPSGSDANQRVAYRAWTTIPIRFGDQDVLGHVNNVAIAGYFEHARCMQLIPALQSQTPRLSTVLARITIDYRSELHFPGMVDVGVRISRFGTKSFVITGAIFRDETCIAVAEATMVFFDPSARRSVVPTQPVLDALEKLR